MTNVPAASASHQITQTTTVFGTVVLFVKTNAATTMNVLITVDDAKEMIANLATPAGLSNVRYPLDQRSMSHAPANAPRSVPIATEPTSKSDRSAMMQGESDPTKIVGHTRYPRRRMSASARPVVGHRGVAAGLTAGNDSAN